MQIALLLAQTSSSDDRGFSIPILFAAAAVAVVWLVLCGLVALVRQPRDVKPGPYTQELPPEPPAVAGLLCEDFELGAEAAPATLLDLAARRIVTLEEVQPGHTICRVRRRGEDDTGLTAYERRVLDAVREKAIDGVVPTDALTTGVEDASKSWQRDLAKEVIADAQSRELTRDRWPAALVGVLGVGTVAVFGLIFLSGLVGGDVTGREGVQAAVAGGIAGAGLFVLGAITGGMGRSLAQLPTESGITAATRCLGFQRHLHDNEHFDDVPPAGVAIWGRHLAYAAALGTARTSVAALPFGAEDDHHAWSRRGGRWRRVRVRYPRARPPAWGKHPGLALFLAVVWGGVAAAAIYGLTRLASSAAGDAGLDPTFSRQQLDWIGRGALIACVPFVLVLAWSVYVLVRATPDLWLRREPTGEIVRRRARHQIFQSRGEDSPPKYWYYLALDDGTQNRVRAWRVKPEIYNAHQQGQAVTAVVTPNLGYVREMRAA